MNERSVLEKVVYQFDLMPWIPDKNQIYGDHLVNVLRELSLELGERYWDFTFVVYDHKMRKPLPDFKTSGRNVILIFLADEMSTLPETLCDSFFAIFKAFYPLEKAHRNILPFPVGYSNSAAMAEFIPFPGRKYDASFAGNFLSNRLDFYRQFNFLRYLPPFPIYASSVRKYYAKILQKFRIFRPTTYTNRFGKSICYWSDGFAKGLPREEYAKIISETKIALCPKGFISTECYRLMETMRLGCVIISDELPPSHWYRDSPIIVTKNWLHIDKLVNELLGDPERMLEIHGKTLDWWRDVCSDRAVALYLAGEIRRLENVPQN